MKIDIFSEVQKQGPWGPDRERTIIRETLEQAKLADELGYGIWWEVEHHATEGFSFSSAPEIMLSVISQHTRHLRLGHSGVLAPHKINHPIRIAERAAFLDVVSDGRLELGLARSTPHEWGLFEVDAEDSRNQLEETFRMLPQIWTQDPFNWKSKYFNIADRNIVPKPLQRPHPPLWQTCSSPTSFEQAGRNGVGVLALTLMTPVEAIAERLELYRKAIDVADPVGEVVNNQVAFFTFVHCAETTKEAIEHGASEAAAFYINVATTFVEGRENDRRRALDYAAGKGTAWTGPSSEALAAAEATRPADPAGGDFAAQHQDTAGGMDPEAAALLQKIQAGEFVSGEEVYEILGRQDSIVIGDVETCKRKMERYREAGVDRFMSFHQVGNLRQDHILSSIRLVGQHLIPHFQPAGS